MGERDMKKEQLVGRMTELDVILQGCESYEVDVANVTNKRIAPEWTEGEESYFALLTSTDAVFYQGHFGLARTLPKWTMKSWRYTAADGRVLLLTEWD